MNNIKPKTIEGISWLDFSEIFGVPSGMTLKNQNCSEKELLDFIVRRCRTGGDDGSFRFIRLNQKHTSIIVNAELVSNRPADGVFTDKRGFVISVRTADCLPIFLYDSKVVALLHAGWRGLLAGIINRFFAEVRDFDKVSAKAVIGPAIGPCCFSVGPEVAILFNSGYSERRFGKLFMDLGRFAVDALAESGIKYIYRYEHCTACEPAIYHSFRQEGVKTGQMLAFMSLGG